MSLWGVIFYIQNIMKGQDRVELLKIQERQILLALPSKIETYSQAN